MGIYKIEQKRLPLREQWIMNFVNFLAWILLASDWLKKQLATVKAHTCALSWHSPFNTSPLYYLRAWHRLAIGTQLKQCTNILPSCSVFSLFTRLFHSQNLFFSSWRFCLTLVARWLSHLYFNQYASNVYFMFSKYALDNRRIFADVIV